VNILAEVIFSQIIGIMPPILLISAE